MSLSIFRISTPRRTDTPQDVTRRKIGHAGEEQTLLGAKLSRRVDRFGEDARTHILGVCLEESENPSMLPVPQLADPSILEPLLARDTLHFNPIGHALASIWSGVGLK